MSNFGFSIVIMPVRCSCHLISKVTSGALAWQGLNFKQFVFGSFFLYLFWAKNSVICPVFFDQFLSHYNTTITLCTEYPPFILPFDYLQHLILLGFYDILMCFFWRFHLCHRFIKFKNNLLILLLAIALVTMFMKLRAQLNKKGFLSFFRLKTSVFQTF